MKRRSFNTRLLLFGSIVVVGVLAVFTTVLAPAERIILDFAGSILWWYNDIAHQDVFANITPPDTTRVLGRRSDEFHTTFLISGSHRDGSRVVSGNVLVGIVKNSADSASKVEAISSPFFKIQGIFERSGSVLELEGRGAGLLETKVPRGMVVERGENVWYDAGKLLLVGKVSKVVDSPSNPFLTIFVEHPINFSTLWLVDVHGA